MIEELKVTLQGLVYLFFFGFFGVYANAYDKAHMNLLVCISLTASLMYLVLTIERLYRLHVLMNRRCQ